MTRLLRALVRAPFVTALMLQIATLAPAWAQSNPQLLAVTVDPTPPVDEEDDLFPGQNPIDFFDTFSWRTFVALNWPAEAGKRGVADTTKSIDDKSAPRVWETWKAVEETFLPTGAAPAAWSDPETNALCTNVADLPATPTKLLADLNQGDDNGGFIGPLVAQNRTYVRYEIRLNQLEFETIKSSELFLRAKITPTSANLPDGVIDVKGAWRELKPGESADRYYSRKALAVDPVTGNCDVRDFVLIGFHIGHKTPKRPQWVWSTFEHVDNVRVGAGAPAGTKPSLNNPAAPQVLGPQPDAIDAANPPKADPDPVQVVLETAENKIPATTAAINAKWHADPRIKASFLRFYELVETQWPTAVPPNPVGQGNPFPGRRVANTTMETYVQSDSCIACHSRTSLKTDFVWALSNRAFPVKNNLMTNAKVFKDHVKVAAPGGGD